MGDGVVAHHRLEPAAAALSETLQRGARARVGSQTLKRQRPGFNESYYGFRSFSRLLDEAAARGLIDVEEDEKSGGVIIRGFK